jgi:ubiquinone/menaquinone biosynthesis C-methylase UbiE
MAGRIIPLTLAGYLAKQLHNPSGLLGRVVLPRLFNRRNAALNDLTLECLALEPSDRVLEVGFGGGYLLGRMSAVLTEGALAGVDASPEMVAYCEKRFRSLIQNGRMDIRCASAEALPYPTASFTKACTVNTIFYWRDTGQAMSELGRVLMEGGRLVICFTCKESLEKRAFTRHGIRLFEIAEVRELMEAAGFREVTLMPGRDRHRAFRCAIGTKG